MFKKILINCLWISLILTLGQIPLGEKTLGRHFLDGVGRSFVWAGHQVLTTKWMAGMQHPEWLDSLFEVKRKPVSVEHLSEEDREEVKRILQ